MIRVCILTVSDRVYNAIAEDKSSPALQNLVNAQSGWTVVETNVVPDERRAIASQVTKWADANVADVILTTGGTGFGERDVTPEAVAPLIHKDAPGLIIAMVSGGLQSTPLAALSRPVCGVRHRTIIVTLPGSTKGSIENLESIIDVLGHAVELVRGGSGDGTHKQIRDGKQGAGIGVVPDSKANQRHHHHHHHHHHGGSVGGGHAHQGTLTRPDPVSDLIGTAVADRSRKSPYRLVEFDDAMHIVMREAHVLGAETMPLSPEMVGHILAADISSPESVPGYRASIVDGYAVIAGDGPGTYPIKAVSTAGTSHPQVILTTGFIARVTTGAPVPDGADAVVMVEDTELVRRKGSSDGGEATEEDLIKVLATVRVGDNIREAGSDVAVGDVIMSSGDIISAAGGEVGLIASVGITQVPVIRHPRVAILSTGNELVPYNHPGPLNPPLVRDTNMPSILSSLRKSMPGCHIIQAQGPAEDTTAALEASLRDALSGSDVVITTGGVSMGEADLLKPVLERALGATVWFGRVLMKPGKPTTFATMGDEREGSKKLIFALPGNPVSALVGFYLFVLPALRKMAGYAAPELPIIRVELAHDVRLDPRPEFHRARVVVATTNAMTPGCGHTTRLIAHGTGSQLSSRMLSMRGANALLRMPPRRDGGDDHEGFVKKGEMVDAILIGEI